MHVSETPMHILKCGYTNKKNSVSKYVCMFTNISHNLTSKPKAQVKPEALI